MFYARRATRLFDDAALLADLHIEVCTMTPAPA